MFHAYFPLGRILLLSIGCSSWSGKNISAFKESIEKMIKADVVACGSFTGFTLIPSSKTRMHLFRISDHVYPAAALQP